MRKPPKHQPKTPACFFKLYYTEFGGKGWGWTLWQVVCPGGKVALCSSSMNAPTLEGALAAVERFKKIVARSHIVRP